jgi:hypothetical protein
MLCDIGHHEPQREILAKSLVEAKRQPSLGGDGSAVSCAEVEAYAYSMLWDQFARGHS